MKKSIKSPIVVTSVLMAVLTLPLLSYITFVTFKPEVPETHKEVKGTDTSFLENLPFPEDTKIVSEDNTAEGQTATLETHKTPKDVQMFYENILIPEGWKIETKDQDKNTFMSEYKKDKKTITITSSISQKITIATISLSQR